MDQEAAIAKLSPDLLMLIGHDPNSGDGALPPVPQQMLENGKRWLSGRFDKLREAICASGAVQAFRSDNQLANLRREISKAIDELVGTRNLLAVTMAMMELGVDNICPKARVSSGNPCPRCGLVILSGSDPSKQESAN
jgi:hypothetical protein